jgi:hypothetical protein
MQPFFNSTCPVLYYQNDQKSFLRKLTAIFLLISFAISQYAKQASYLECILSNYLIAPAEKCDCAKIVKQNKYPVNQSPVPVRHNHMHIDESYFPILAVSRELYLNDHLVTSFFTGSSKLHEGARDQPYHPPRV